MTTPTLHTQKGSTTMAISVSYQQPDGSISTIEAADGDSVMDTAMKHGVDGIVAECGGALACATCHVYVGPAFADAVGGPDEFEDELLEGAAAERRDTSRLSCQVIVSADLDGLVVEVPETQV